MNTVIKVRPVTALEIANASKPKVVQEDTGKFLKCLSKTSCLGRCLFPVVRFLEGRPFRLAVNGSLSLFSFVVLLLNIFNSYEAEDKYSTTFPSDRCLPLFQRVKNSLMSPQLRSSEFSTDVLYSYNAGYSALLACTNQTAGIVNEEFGEMQSDPMKIATGCSVSNSTELAQMLEYCVDEDGNPMDCNAVLMTPPLSNGDPDSLNPGFPGVPQGYLYYWLPQNITTVNSTSANLYYEYPCAVSFKRINSIPCNLENAQVFTYIKRNEAVRLITIIGFSLNVILAIAQVMSRRITDPSSNQPKFETDPQTHGFCIAGLGAIPALYDICRGRYKVPNIEPHLSWQAFLFILTCTIFGSIISPAIAISGCNPRRFLRSFVLLLLSGVKVIMTIYSFIRRQCTPEVCLMLLWVISLIQDFVCFRSKWNSVCGMDDFAAEDPFFLFGAPNSLQEIV